MNYKRLAALVAAPPVFAICWLIIRFGVELLWSPEEGGNLTTAFAFFFVPMFVVGLRELATATPDMCRGLWRWLHENPKIP